jgi:hypothetical protein
MDRKTGYLSNLFNVPPLIFRFQFNPEILQDKKSYKYETANEFASASFDKARAASSFAGGALGALDDIKELSPFLVKTKALEAREGETRVISLEFKLDASIPGPMDGSSHYNGSIMPDLALLRSFMYPSIDLADITKLIFESGFRPRFNPPEVSLSYGGISTTCVMTDLDIKLVAFKDDGDPLRAEVNVTLKEQTLSLSPMVEFAVRYIDIARSYDRKGIGMDFAAVTPIVGSFL